MKKSRCPHCNYVETNHETLEGEIKPSIGDISFCLSCGELGEFVESGIIKIKPGDLVEETRRPVKKIEAAWLQTRSLSKNSKK